MGIMLLKIETWDRGQTYKKVAYTVPLETISAFACGNTSSLPIVFTAKSPRLDENRNPGKDESNRMPGLT